MREMASYKSGLTVTVLHDYPVPCTFIWNSSAFKVHAARRALLGRMIAPQVGEQAFYGSFFLMTSTITSGQSNLT